MKQYELRDLETGKEYIVVYHNKDKWIPCDVKVVKEYTVKFIRPENQVYSPLEFNKEYSINDFGNSFVGIDLFGNKLRGIYVFDTYKLAELFCEFENYIDEYDASIESKF